MTGDPFQHTYTYTHTNIREHTQIYDNTHTNIGWHTHKHSTHIHIHTHTHTHTYTHTQRYPSVSSPLCVVRRMDARLGEYERNEMKHQTINRMIRVGERVY